ncbi:MAG: IS30 family transposase [Acidimicrobiales bacterium]
MEHYHQLTKVQRYQIGGLKQAGLNQSQTAEKIGVHRSTICREIKRNAELGSWRPDQADELATMRAINHNAAKFTAEDWQCVDALIEKDYSPEQIQGRMRLENTLVISHETIYGHIYADKADEGTLYKHLRCQKKRRKRYGSGEERRGMIKNRVSIDNRPAVVGERKRIGDWEGDTVIGKNHKGALVTLTERVSRYECAEILATKEAPPVTASITDLLEPYSDRVHTITFDNGKEFAGHERIAQNLDAEVYFAHPYHSWERGLNENTNGLLRQYFPKGTDFRKITQTQVEEALERINHRPRKVLDFRSPY